MVSAVPFEGSDIPAPGTAARTDGDSALHFLAGGGEMGARMRRFDWAKSPLGAPGEWPQSLKTIVRMMLDSRYAMWMLWGPEYTFFCNDAYLPTVGIKRDWVLGARADEVWEEVWDDVIEPRLDPVLNRGQATWDEALLIFLERSGFPEETYHTFSYSPVHGDDNRIAGMLCVVTEVTERVIGERRLRALSELASQLARVESVGESCRRASAVFAHYPLDMPFAALYLADGDAARRIALVGAQDSPALPASLRLDECSSPWPIAAMLADDSAHEVRDLPALGIDIGAGEWPDRVQQAMLLPLKSAGHGLAGFLIAGVSPRRAFNNEYRAFLDLVAGQIASAIGDAQAYESERRRAEALAELDRAKTAFFSNVSHEFRTPLTLMLGPLLEALGDDALAPPVRERLDLAYRNAIRLQRLVNSLLDFSRIEAGRVQARYEPTDLSALTRDIASTFRSAMEQAGLAFTVECAPLDDVATVDREMWEKIVLNLLSNAFKFTLAGSVAVRMRRDGRAAVLEIADTGVGIPEHELPRMFERFHRVESTHGRTHEGSGIGLALVHELVKLHGGTIEASSRLGEGTTLRVAIPLGAALSPEEARAASAPPYSGTSTRTFVEEALRWLPASRVLPARDWDADGDVHPHDRRFAPTFGARIVLADDNADMRTYVQSLLAPFYTVEAAVNGAEALAAAQRTTPDLILSDVMMPELDGFGLLAAVRRDPALQSIPVVLLSARAGEESRIEGLDSGADDYIVKPFSARELLARVGGLLELRRMRRLRAAQFETLLNEAPLGVFLVDSAFRLRDANPTARAAMGGPSELIGEDLEKVLREIWPAPRASEVAARIRRTLETGEPCVVPETIEERRDRSATEYYEWQISRIPLPDGQNGVVCYFRDISQHVRARMQLEAADRQKDEFLAMLAHELRNPLAPIRNAGEVLSRLNLREPRAEQAVGVVQRQITTLTRLVDDLLDVSRITRGRVELQMKPVQVSDVVSQAVEMVEPLVKEKRQRLSTTTYRALRVQGDPARLVQCVSNVLTNAVKYTDDGGAIQLEVREDDGDALLTVTDNGIGIPAELQSRVFDLFVQGERALDRAQGGLGIGLSVVKRLVEMHGGSISVTSEGAGRGSRFEMRLPLLERVAPAEVHAPPVQVTPRRILVVDDNEDAADSLTMVLQLDGHEVASAYTAEDALVLAQAFRPDVGLLDVGLPRMDGYELAARLRAMPGFERVHLVALTGYGQPGDRERALAAGFDSHLVKPAEYRALQEIIERVKP